MESDMESDMKITFKPGNKIKYGQDFHFFEGVPPGITFKATRIDERIYKLTAPGYGGNPYGRGALFITVKERTQQP